MSNIHICGNVMQHNICYELKSVYKKQCIMHFLFYCALRINIWLKEDVLIAGGVSQSTPSVRLYALH